MSSLDNLISKIKEISQDEDKLNGIYLAIPTGNVLEEDKTFIQIRLYGKLRYAKPCFPFGWFNIPSQEWLQKYKEEIAIWIMFENGDRRFPVWVGVAPLNEKVPSGNFQNTTYFKSEKFSITLDDKEELFEIKNFEETGFISAKKYISLLYKNSYGIKALESSLELGKDGEEKTEAVLSNKLITLLGDILDELAKITVISPVGETSPPKNIANILAFKQRLDAIKSKSVKID